MMRSLLEQFRLRLGYADALAPLALLGLLSGAVAGALLLGFRFVVEWILGAALPNGNAEGFEQLDVSIRFALPVAGSLLIAMLFAALGAQHSFGGVVHVMERLAYHQGHMPWRNALAQVAGACISLCSGHSLGREGPGVHLGSAAGSWVGSGLGVPNNSMRTLIACGTAASIAASFNTPIAGVIFAMEVVMMEYTIIGFTPVMLAAAVAAWMSRAAYGGEAAFAVPSTNLSSLLELPWLVVVGGVIGLLAATFVRGSARLQRAVQTWSVHWRFVVAGTITGAVAVVVPQVMGIGYDTVEILLQPQVAVQFALMVLAGKFLASVACVGFGLPAGLIAPTLFIGAAAGAALGLLGQMFAPDMAADSGFYAILGMTAMMGACLQAPLAALMAALELTANVNIILPCMVCLVSAVLVSRSVCKTDPVFVALLRVRGADYMTDPVALSLSRSAITTRMSAAYIELSSPAPQRLESWRTFHTGRAEWFVVGKSIEDMEVYDARPLLDNAGDNPGPLPALLHAPISVRATVQEAREKLGVTGTDVLLVQRRNGAVCGVVNSAMLGVA
jgi:chloride channel protein, CIC family